ncbi:MAG: NUDIX domain-containing protein [bacterium]
MKYDIRNYLMCLLKSTPMNATLKKQFISRIQKGFITRDENPTSHLCVYFAAYDPSLKLVFIGRHIKSGLWLFNGGHIDKQESLEHALYREMGEEWGLIKKVDIDSPSLFTLTEIENPKKQTCEWHYDIWYFVPFKKHAFHPNKQYLSKEFFEWGWKTIMEAKSLVRDKGTSIGIDYLNNSQS